MDMVLIGASGYGGHYIDLIDRFVDPARHRLVAAADPYMDKADDLAWLKKHDVRLYTSPEECLEKEAPGRTGAPGLALICSPIQFHQPQAALALEKGFAVLCEKPLCATVALAEDLLRAQGAANRPFGVGFQWSFSPTMLALKRDILDGLFGKPLCLRTLISWKRGDAYYAGGWKGRLADDAGRPVRDNIAMNATAHYLHNMLFLLGNAMDTAALPARIEAMALRGRPIETYDTCFVRGRFANGAQLLYCASHVGEANIDPIFRYTFEKGEVTFDNNTDALVKARFADGSEKAYGHPQSMEEGSAKLLAMLDAAEGGAAPVCGIETAMPHLRVCEAITEKVTVADIPAELRVMETDPAGVHVPGMNAALRGFYDTGDTPAAFPWAPAPAGVDL